MARWDFKLPDIGEGVTEGEIVSWLIAPGDAVAEDQPMIEVMTDKATVTITAPRAGTVVETRGKVGDVVAVHAVLVVSRSPGRRIDARRAPGASNGHVVLRPSGPAATAVGDLRESLPGMGAPPRPPAAQVEAYFNARPLAAPAARKLARDLDVDIRRVAPTGPQGRVTKKDIEGFGSVPPHEENLAAAPGRVAACGDVAIAVVASRSCPCGRGRGGRARAVRGDAPEDRAADGAVQAYGGALHLRRGVRRDGAEGAA